jgi:hypothetical protein
MNIFYLDPDPKTCAEMHISKHVVKMIIEYAQLMSTAHRLIDGEEYTDLTANGRRIKRWRLHDDREQLLMKASHINHPSAIWCRANHENYDWLYMMWKCLLKEYTYRYGKVHACARLVGVLFNSPKNIQRGNFFPPTPAMPPEVKVLAENPHPGRKYDSLKSYHNYYINNKKHFASWQGKINSRNIPDWFKIS